eukprot:757160-Hanusia_phi.AAC.5
MCKLENRVAFAAMAMQAWAKCDLDDAVGAGAGARRLLTCWCRAPRCCKATWTSPGPSGTATRTAARSLPSTAPATQSAPPPPTLTTGLEARRVCRAGGDGESVAERMSGDGLRLPDPQGAGDHLRSLQGEEWHERGPVEQAVPHPC